MKGFNGAEMNDAQLWKSQQLEDFLAELAAATYGVALRHEVKGSFIDLELELWQALRGVVRDELRRQST
jgi:hypothetical protein